MINQEQIKITQVNIADLKPSEYNPRIASDKETRDLRESIARFGFIDPLIVNNAPERTNVVIGGHFRLRVAKEMGYRQAPVVYINIPDIARERELNLRLNKNLGDWRWDLLAGFGEDMLKDVGFSVDEMQKIFDMDAQEDGLDAEAEYAGISEAQTKRGDIYQLGEHRLLCGDSALIDDVNKVMQGELSDMIFTDPPYNINYNCDVKYGKIHKARKKRFLRQGQILNDKKDAQAFYNFLLNVFRNCYAVSKPHMSIYICHATKTQDEFFDAFRDSGFYFSQTIIWLKERIILALGQDYHRVYEPIIFGWKENEKHYKNKQITTESEVWDIDRLRFEERLDVWFLARDKAFDYEHPTQKPIRLSERAIKKNCPVGGVLFEPFAGSGSTLMAAHQLGRKCYAIELDPKYCDIIVRRWERFAGKKAERIVNA